MTKALFNVKLNHIQALRKHRFLIFCIEMITGACISLTLAVASHKPPGSHKTGAQPTAREAQWRWKRRK